SLGGYGQHRVRARAARACVLQGQSGKGERPERSLQANCSPQRRSNLRRELRRVVVALRSALARGDRAGRLQLLVDLRGLPQGRDVVLSLLEDRLVGEAVADLLLHLGE